MQATYNKILILRNIVQAGHESQDEKTNGF